jgi:hypothetical protein
VIDGEDLSDSCGFPFISADFQNIFHKTSIRQVSYHTELMAFQISRYPSLMRVISLNINQIGSTGLHILQSRWPPPQPANQKFGRFHLQSCDKTNMVCSQLSNNNNTAGPFHIPNEGQMVMLQCANGSLWLIWDTSCPFWCCHQSRIWQISSIELSQNPGGLQPTHQQ